jgi:perosamine synthetase
LKVEIPLSAPDINQEEIDAIVDVLRSGRLSLGRKLEEFESGVAAYSGAAYAVGVSSGTAALHLAIRALGLEEGDEVILPSFSFIAAANVLRYERISPVFVDIDSRTLNLNVSRIEEAITSRTRAILVVHTFGVPAAMYEIMDIARRRGLIVIEDACEALGAQLGGKKVGTFGDVGVFAFYPNKQITTAEGGVLITENPQIATRVRSLRNHGRAASGEQSEHAEIGYNYRLSELHCALGVEQLKRIEKILLVRENVARGYHQRLKQSSGIETPLLEFPGGRISWFVYAVRLADCSTVQRDEVIRKLALLGIQTGRYFAPIHLQPAYRDLPPPRTPLSITESVAGRTIALPFFNRLTNSQLDAICDALRACVELVTRNLSL